MSDRIEKTLRSATRLQRTGEQLAALQIIEGMIRKHPANPRLINKRNFLCREITKSQADIDPPGFVLRKLAVLFDSSQWMELNHICREIIKLHPKSGQLINIYAVAKREIGDVDEALQLHRQAISLEPINPSFLLNLGNSLVE